MECKQDDAGEVDESVGRVEVVEGVEEVEVNS